MRKTRRNDSSSHLQSRIEVFFDGDCPLCKREVAFLTKRDKHRRIVATDIAHASFDASKFGRSQQEFMATIQGRLADGTWISGVEVFRNLYAAVGFTRLVRISRFRPLAWILDLSYAFFAKHRLRLTGRCASNACSIPAAVANTNESSQLSDPGVATKRQLRNCRQG
jgi:predicted DCC family thiol-disulfide oxidoreductase YuxK